VKACDNFSAFMEAYSTLSLGTKAKRLFAVLPWGLEKAIAFRNSGIDFEPEVISRIAEVTPATPGG